MAEEPVKITSTDYTAEGAAAFLRRIAEGTRSGSQDWDNYEAICATFLKGAMDAGRAFGRNEKRDTAFLSPSPCDKS